MDDRGYLILFSVLWLFRYLRLIGNCWSFATYKPIPISKKPTFDSHDVTIILPTVAKPEDIPDLDTTLRTCLANNPYEVIVVTKAKLLNSITDVAKKIDERIRVLSVPEGNKRRQMCHAIPEVKTSITVFEDDDVIWQPTTLKWMLAPFEDPDVGGVGTNQRLKRNPNGNMFDFFGAVYLARRNFDCISCLNMDGGLPCLSGRTSAYRTSILQDEAFQFAFQNETWRTCQLNSDDDNFITRWLFTNQWKIRMQYHPDAEIQTTLENSPKYLNQCLRWVRSNWRSNLSSLFIDRLDRRHCLISYPWTTYSVFQTTLTAWSLLWDFSLIFLFHMASQHWSTQVKAPLWTFVLLWTFLFSKTVKLWPHFWRHPQDLIYLPHHIVFGYFHNFIKLWGLLTLNETTWGSRDEADENDNVRMIKLPAYGTVQPEGRRSNTFHASPEVSTPGNNLEALPAYFPFPQNSREPSSNGDILIDIDSTPTTSTRARNFSADDLV